MEAKFRIASCWISKLSRLRILLSEQGCKEGITLNREEVLSNAIDAMVNCDEKRALEIAEKAIAEGFDPVDILSEGFSVGIRKVGDLFGEEKCFTPINT